MEFEFINHIDPSFDEYEKLFTALLGKTLLYLKISDNVILETSLVTNDMIQAMNKQFRGIDQATDVLSFAFLDKVEGEPSIKNAPFINLGALVISTEKAISQAQEYGHSLKREMSFLFVHGLLHLCGYDHQTNEQEQQMIALQTAILGKRDI